MCYNGCQTPRSPGDTIHDMIFKARKLAGICLSTSSAARVSHKSQNNEDCGGAGSSWGDEGGKRQ